MNVAIVDDERKIREGLFKLIDWKRFNMNVTGRYEDGEVALEAFAKNIPDIVITDIRMPFIDGIELIEKCEACEYGIKFIIISGYDEFALAQKALRLGAIDYLLKPVKKEELEMLLKRVSVDIDAEKTADAIKIENIYNELLFNANADADASKLQKVQVTALEKIRQFIVLVTNIEIGEIDCNYAAAVHGDGHTVIVLTGENNQDCSEKAKRVIRSFNDNSFTGISSSTSKGTNLSRLYREAMDVCRLSEKFPGRNSANYSELSKFPVVEYKEIEKSGMKLFSAVRDLNKSESEKILRDLRTAFLNGRVDEYAADFLLSGVFKEGLELIKNHGSEFSNDYISRLKDFKNIEDYGVSRVPDKLDEYISLLFDAVVKKKCKNDRPEIKRALQHIFDNYNNKNLDINEVAATAGVSSGYFSTLFKNETGLSFSEYLCSYRIDAAKKLLSSGNYKNYEIAELTGFRNSAYFCSVFKKITGTTPGAYRDGL